MKKLFPFAVFFLIAFISYSQKVENVDFNFVDERIVIFYDLVDCDSKYRYEVEIKFTDDRGNTVIPRVLNGDYGRVTCGKNKRVEWNPFQEMSAFEGNYKVSVSITNVYDRLGKPVTISSKEIQQKTQRSFDVSAYAKFVRIPSAPNIPSSGISLGYYLFNHNIIVGTEFGYVSSLFNQQIDFSVFLGTTPKLMNNNYVSIGLIVNPISYVYEEPGEAEYHDEYGPGVGFYGCFEFGRVKLIPGIAYYFHETVYYAWGSEQDARLSIFASLKVRLF